MISVGDCGRTSRGDASSSDAASSATAASNLKALTAAGLLERRPYQEQGERARQEYVLTDAGTDLMPVLIGLFEWGIKHGQLRSGVETVHAGCGQPAEVQVRCRDGHPLSSDDVELRVRSTDREARR